MVRLLFPWGLNGEISFFMEAYKYSSLVFRFDVVFYALCNEVIAKSNIIILRGWKPRRARLSIGKRSINQKASKSKRAFFQVQQLKDTAQNILFFY